MSEKTGAPSGGDGKMTKAQELVARAYATATARRARRAARARGVRAAGAEEQDNE